MRRCRARLKACISKTMTYSILVLIKRWRELEKMKGKPQDLVIRLNLMINTILRKVVKKELSHPVIRN